jgi:hypothetical protein
VALGNPLVDPGGHDLARDIKPPVSVLDIFPWSEMLLQVILVAGVSLFMLGFLSDLNSKLRSAQAELATLTSLKDHDQAKLDAESRDLRDRDVALRAYLKSRVAWSTLLETIVANIPENTVLINITCSSELVMGPGGTAGIGKKSLVADFATSMSDENDVPPEIDLFINNLRAEPVLKRLFATLEVTSLKTNSGQRGGAPYASYSVVCEPSVAPKTKG